MVYSVMEAAAFEESEDRILLVVGTYEDEFDGAVELRFE
jgi:hypothetical protein